MTGRWRDRETEGRRDGGTERLRDRRDKGRFTIGDESGKNTERKKTIRRHTDLEVYRRAFAAAMRIFELTKNFPKEERYSLTDQIRRSSRSVCTNIGEAWRKRRYQAAWISKLSDSEGEAAIWLQFSVECGYLSRETGAELYTEYDAILGMLVDMTTHPEEWCF
jgi:four helix bundle protein